MTRFTFDYLRDQMRAVIGAGYTIVMIHDYVRLKRENALPEKVAALRIDVDFSVRKCEFLCAIFSELDIKGSFFFRLHAPRYNLFDFENFRVLKLVRDAGHEIGLHSEVIDQSMIWNEDASACLRRDISVLSTMIGRPIFGVASHGDMTGYNNLDFWKEHSAAEFGLEYEAYDDAPGFGLFKASRYVSDSEWIRWKSYDNGVLRRGDQRPPSEHAGDGVPALYLLLHSDTYYVRHIHE